MEDNLLEVCLLAGKIMMESTAEMYRVEDTILRIGRKMAVEIVCYTTQTGLFVGILGQSNLRMTQVNKRMINLDKVTKVNQFSREFSDGLCSLEELLERLKVLEKEHLFFPQWLELLSAAVISASMMILFGGVMWDFPLTFLIGSSGFIVYLLVAKVLQIRFLAEFFACFFVGILCIGAMKMHLSQESRLNVIMIGAVMPFVPGVSITNSIRDLLAGHLLSGLSRGIEGIMTACAIGFGIAFAFQIF